MTNGVNRKSYNNINGHFKSKGVYEMLKTCIVPETSSWKNNLKFPSTNEMLEDIVNQGR